MVVDDIDEEPWPFPGPPGSLPWHSREDRRDHEIAGRVQSRKERGAPPPRRDRGLSREEIVRAAIAVADAEGSEAISMRRIARELRAGAMSLYWHVGSKEELLDLMFEQLLGEIEIPGPGDWKSNLRAFAHDNRAGLLRHPWAIHQIGARPRPSDVRNLERLLAMLDGLDLSPRLAVDVLTTLVTYVTGAVVREVQEMRGEREHQLLEAELTKEELTDMHEKFRQWFETSGNYPRITAVLAAGVDPDDPETRDERFAFGLECMLDGLEVRITASGGESGGG